MLSCEFCKTFKNTSFISHLRATSSKFIDKCHLINFLRLRQKNVSQERSCLVMRDLLYTDCSLTGTLKRFLIIDFIMHEITQSFTDTDLKISLL